MFRELTAEELQHYQEHGYVVIPGLITSELVEELLGDYQNALDGKFGDLRFEGRRVAGTMVQLRRPAEHVPGWKEHAYMKNALSVARQLEGPKLDYAYDQIISKPAGCKGETAWHQDSGYWKDQDQAVTCWLALGEVFAENGAMRFIPGSHLGELQEHTDASEHSQINNALETKVSAQVAEQEVVAPLHPGDATFHHCRTLHRTTGNSSDIARCGLITHFFPKQDGL